MFILMEKASKDIDPYITRYPCSRRIEEEYKEHGSLFVAFDYDNTVFDYHGKGFTFPIVQHLLRRCKAAGMKLILFTAKEKDEDLAPIVEECRKQGYEPDYVNESPVMNTRKPYYNILLDDRAGLGQAVMILNDVIEKIERKELCKY